MTNWGGGKPWNPGVGWTEAGMEGGGGWAGRGQSRSQLREQVTRQPLLVCPQSTKTDTKTCPPHAGDSASWRPVQPCPSPPREQEAQRGGGLGTKMPSNLHQNKPPQTAPLVRPWAGSEGGATMNQGASWEKAEDGVSVGEHLGRPAPPVGGGDLQFLHHSGNQITRVISEPRFFADLIVSDRYIMPAKLVYRG